MRKIDHNGSGHDVYDHQPAGGNMTDTAYDRAERAANHIDTLSQIHGHGDIHPRDVTKLVRYLETNPTLTDRLLNGTHRPKSLTKLDNVTTDLEIGAACMNACAHFFEEHHGVLSSNPAKDAALTARLQQCAADSLALLATWDEREQIIANTYVAEPAAGSMAARYAAEKGTTAPSLQKAHAYHVMHHMDQLLSAQQEVLHRYRAADPILHHPHDPPVLRICTLAEQYLQDARTDMAHHFQSFGTQSAQRG